MTITWLGITVLIFLVFACYTGYKRGLIREVVSLLCVFLSMAVVWFINPYVNQFIRENTSIYENIQESCRQFVEEKEKTSGTDAGESQENAIENMNLPGLLTSGLTQNNTAEVYQYLSVSTFSDYIAQYLARMAVNGISFLISFILATLLIRSITWMLDLVARLPVIKGANKIAGAAFAAAKYILILWIVFLVLTVLCNTEIGETCLKAVKQDTVLSWLYDQDILIRIFMNIFYVTK